jgi:hypothetical protein
MDDHELAEFINALTGIAKEFGTHQSLRERIAQVVVPKINALRAAAKNHEYCMGVGDGSGNLFVYGDEASIKAARALIFKDTK